MSLFSTISSAFSKMVGVANKEKPGSIESVSLDQISSNPFKPRSSIDPEAIDRLADSIQNFGQINPLTITPVEQHDRYYLISGERRLEALQVLDRSEAPCLIRHMSERELLEVSLAENTHREPLSLIDELEACERIMKRMEFSSLETVANKFFNGRAEELLESRGLLQLGEVGREAYRQQLITRDQAEILNEFNDELQEEIIKQYEETHNFRESVLEIGLPYPRQKTEDEKGLKSGKSVLMQEYMSIENPLSVYQAELFDNESKKMLPTSLEHEPPNDRQALPKQ